ncbi:protein PHLOEM PROTEIN 2-LIKE A10-like [Punica granatum]|uniref:Uncharacterized protein n=2 Tax=Punica granatum TaxID=22663 RepID=A0A2I0KS63_PUNGR|nr:protein PHLOEM PROTEIN 2-LIKE A10-like [Punica granatum]PKI71334.1 hypothetical protein CRG98_008334 [Punica granatum]
MDARLMETGFQFSRKRKKWILLLGAFGLSWYGLYRAYHLPSVAWKRRRLMKLVGAVVSVAEAVSDSSEMIGIVSKDLNEFLRSNSDEIPNSIKQISKIAKSREFTGSVTGVTQALTLGILRGYNRSSHSDGSRGSSSFADRVLDKIFTPAGSGFASVVVGSFARSLVMAFYDQTGGAGSESGAIPAWVNLLCSDKGRELIGDCIQLFVSSAIAVYLEKTMDINTYDEILAGMTNPKHDAKVQEMLVSVCNNAVETLVRTSHDVLTSPNPNGQKSPGSGLPDLAIEEYSKGEDLCSDDNDNKDNGWVTKVSSTLAVPRNKKLVLDLTGRVTSETVRSVMEFALEKACEGMVRRVNHVQETVTDRGRQVMRYVTAKSNVITTVCLSVCLHVLESAWILAPVEDDERWR